MPSPTWRSASSPTRRRRDCSAPPGGSARSRGSSAGRRNEPRSRPSSGRFRPSSRPTRTDCARRRREDAGRRGVQLAPRSRGSRKRPLSGWASLTPTEAQVVKLVSEGLTKPQIADRMFISRATVKVHLGHVFQKLDVRSRSELAAQSRGARLQPRAGVRTRTPARRRGAGRAGSPARCRGSRAAGAFRRAGSPRAPARRRAARRARASRAHRGARRAARDLANGGRSAAERSPPSSSPGRVTGALQPTRRISGRAPRAAASGARAGTQQADALAEFGSATDPGLALGTPSSRLAHGFGVEASTRPVGLIAAAGPPRLAACVGEQSEDPASRAEHLRAQLLLHQPRGELHHRACADARSVAAGDVDRAERRAGLRVVDRRRPSTARGAPPRGSARPRTPAAHGRRPAPCRRRSVPAACSLHA